MNATRNCFATLALAVSAAFAQPAAAATYSINQIDFVDPVTHVMAAFTQLWGNNNNGQVVGIASPDPTGATGTFSFVYDPSTATFTRVAPPAGVDPANVSVISINDNGDITGTIFDGVSTYTGFILRSGVYSYFSDPGWADTQARTISDPTVLHPQGLVVGYSTTADFTSSTGFIYNPISNAFVNFAPSPFTIAQGLNIAGQVVGHVRNPSAPIYSGFLYTPTGPDPMGGGTISTFNINGFPTKARGINDSGVLAAAVTDVPGSAATHAYVATGLGYQLIPIASAVGPDCADGNAPGAFPEGLNNNGQVTGLLTDNHGACAGHGFIATPSYPPTGVSVDGAYTFDINVVPNTAYFLDPAVAIGYDYKIGNSDTRFATVRLPLGIGDNKFILVVNHKAYALNAGQLFDFRTIKKKGVKGFRVVCIDPAAMLDPVNSLAFPTEVSFATTGEFTGTQKPLTKVKFQGTNLTKMTQDQCRTATLGAADADGPDAD